MINTIEKLITTLSLLFMLFSINIIQYEIDDDLKTLLDTSKVCELQLSELLEELEND